MDPFIGPDIEFCHAEFNIDNEYLDEAHDNWMGDWVDSNCAVRYFVRPALGSPSDGSWGGLPLPYLRVDDVAVDRANDQLQIHVRNTGDATWPGKDLEVVVKRHAGNPIGYFVEPELVLMPGELVVLQWDDLAPEHPEDVCITLDPGNAVLEENEGIGWDGHYHCEPLPDLEATGVTYHSGDDTLLIHVRNSGEGDLENRDLGVRIDMADGSYFAAPASWWSDFSLDQYQRASLAWTGIGPDQRERMRGGYTVVLDPEDTIAETNGGNNTYEVRATSEVVVWVNAFMTQYYDIQYRRSPQDHTYYMDLDQKTTPPYRLLARGTYGPTEIDDDAWRPHSVGINVQEFYQFELAGDENLTVFFSGDIEDTGIYWLGSAEQVFTPEENWGATETISWYEHCSASGRREDQHYWYVYPEEYALRRTGPWGVLFNICIVEE
jgi:hypothetical protein